MATHGYEQHLSSRPEDNYQHLQWGTAADSSPSPSTPTPKSADHPIPQDKADCYFDEPQRQGPSLTINADYSRVAAVDTSFKKLKSNQVEVLKQLRREYEVLRNTELDSGIFSNNRAATDSVESNV